MKRKIKQYKVQLKLWFKRQKNVKVLAKVTVYTAALATNYFTIDSLIITIGLTALFLAFTRK